jgi:hypothetical protein
MVMMTGASHRFVDQKLREAAEGIEKAQRETAAKKGYKNFEMAVRAIYECRTEIDQETENDAVIGHLKTAAVALARPSPPDRDGGSGMRRPPSSQLPALTPCSSRIT